MSRLVALHDITPKAWLKIGAPYDYLIAMVRTRGQERAETNGEARIEARAPHKKNAAHKTREEPQQGRTADLQSGRVNPNGAGAVEEDGLADEPTTKRIRQGRDKDIATEANRGGSEVEKLLSKYGDFPFQNSLLPDPTEPTAETMLAHLLNAILTSTRISHHLAQKTVTEVIKAGWTNIDTLEKTSWEERTEVLTKGGYTHYREKTATRLGDLTEWLRNSYDGNLNNLCKAAREEAGNDHQRIRAGVRKRLEAIKGVGGVALDIFCDTAQGLWHELAPFVDPRSDKTAKDIGIPTDVEKLYESVGRNPVQMCKLAYALTVLRLEKKETEFR